MIKEGPRDSGVTIYCDQEKEHELLGAVIARWHEARLKNDPSLASFPLEGPRTVEIHYGPKRRFLPLQAADILANDTYRRISDYLKTGLMDDPYFTNCMRQDTPEKLTNYFYFDVGLLDADYKYSFRKRDPNLIVETSKLRFS